MQLLALLLTVLVMLGGVIGLPDVRKIRRQTVQGAASSGRGVDTICELECEKQCVHAGHHDGSYCITNKECVCINHAPMYCCSTSPTNLHCRPGC